MKKTQASIRVGMSGWVYPDWRARFYPEDLPQRRELEFASEQLRTIEINGTFYSLQTLKSYQRWHDETPEDFVFAVKGPKFITHTRKLVDVKGPLANFFASGILALGKKLGPILWQLPPNLAFDSERMESFFKLLPKTSTAAAKLAKHPDAHFKAEPYAVAGSRRAIRHALEVRNESFRANEKVFVSLAKKYGIAIIYADVPADEEWPVFDVVSADFQYARLQGGQIRRGDRYSPTQLKKWALTAKKWRGSGSGGRDVFIYLDKGAKPFAPVDAMKLQKLI